jgi:toxin ParE1/3/4
MIVHFAASAQADIQAIFDYIARDNPLIARRVVSEIEQATNRLRQFPFSGRVGAVESTRELVIARLPFIVVYRVGDSSVDVIAVFHAARDLPRGF